MTELNLVQTILPVLYGVGMVVVDKKMLILYISLVILGLAILFV